MARGLRRQRARNAEPPSVPAGPNHPTNRASRREPNMFDPRLLSDPQIIAALAIAAALLVLALVLVFRRPRTDHLSESLAELQGRLAQMAGTQAASQASMAE